MKSNLNREDFINTKINVSTWTKEAKAELQEHVFLLGFHWPSHFQPQVRYLDSKYYCAHDDMEFTHSKMDCSFESCDFKELTYSDIFPPQDPEMPLNPLGDFGDDEIIHCTGVDLASEPDKTMIGIGAKFDGEKPMYNLLPPVAIDEMAQVLTFGAVKYGPESWRSVPEGLERYRAALLRHAFAIQSGELIDPESGLSHASHIMCNAAFILELQKAK